MTENKRFVAVNDDLIKDTKYDSLKNNIFVADMLNCLMEENKELKADNNRLVNETAKSVAEHQKKVLDLIDKSLEKNKQYYEMSYEDYLNGRIEALEELKKELIEQ
jgi:predicted component of type VI protein secretion system